VGGEKVEAFKCEECKKLHNFPECVCRHCIFQKSKEEEKLIKLNKE